MAVPLEIHHEIDVLAQFDASNHQQGIKIHKSADAALIHAAARLFDKGLISQVDGGYLTRRGIEVIEQLQAALTILDSEIEDSRAVGA